jgi:hypothetical protein
VQWQKAAIMNTASVTNGKALEAKEARLGEKRIDTCASLHQASHEIRPTFVVGHVPEVNGSEACEVPQFVPTKRELMKRGIYVSQPKKTEVK